MLGCHTYFGGPGPQHVLSIFFTYEDPKFIWSFLDGVNNVIFILFGCLCCNFSDLIACPPVPVCSLSVLHNSFHSLSFCLFYF